MNAVPEMSGVDLARQALLAAREAAKKNGARTTKPKRRTGPTLRRDGRDRLGPGAAITMMMTERGLIAPAAGGSVLAQRGEAKAPSRPMPMRNQAGRTARHVPPTGPSPPVSTEAGEDRLVPGIVDLRLSSIAYALTMTGTYPYPYPVGMDLMGRRTTMSDANVRIPKEARDRLAEVAAAEGLSLRAYLARLAENVLTPTERAERAAKAKAVLTAWTGYAPTASEEAALDHELDRRLAQVQHP